MIVFCNICNKPFLWISPSGYSGRPPKICGKVAEDGHWIPNSKCEVERTHRGYLKWKAKQPYSTWKGNPEDKPKLREKNITKGIPKVKQYPCRRCGEFSVNRFYCPICLTRLSDRIAGDEYIFAGCGATLDIEI